MSEEEHGRTTLAAAAPDPKPTSWNGRPPATPQASHRELCCSGKVLPPLNPLDWPHPQNGRLHLAASLPVARYFQCGSHTGWGLSESEAEILRLGLLATSPLVTSSTTMDDSVDDRFPIQKHVHGQERAIRSVGHPHPRLSHFCLCHTMSFCGTLTRPNGALLLPLASVLAQHSPPSLHIFSSFHPPIPLPVQGVGGG